MKRVQGGKMLIDQGMLFLGQGVMMRALEHWLSREIFPGFDVEVTHIDTDPGGTGIDFVLRSIGEEEELG